MDNFRTGLCVADSEKHPLGGTCVKDIQHSDSSGSHEHSDRRCIARRCIARRNISGFSLS